MYGKIVHGLLEENQDKREVFEKLDEGVEWYEGIAFSEEATF